MNKIRLPLELKDLAVMPVKASEWAAAYDLRASEAYVIAPGETVLISTGIKLALSQGFELQVRPRSGLSLRSRLRIANTPGTIDADYRDEIKIIIHNNFSQSEIPQLIAESNPLCERYGSIVSSLSLEEYCVRKSLPLPAYQDLQSRMLYFNDRGDLWGTEYIEQYERIAQIVLADLVNYEFELVHDVHDIGQNRGGGFGHSGRV